MDIANFIQKFFLYLLPGIFGLIIFEHLTPQKERHYYKEFVFSFILSFVSFLIVDILISLFNLLCPKSTVQPLNIVAYISNMQGVIPNGIFFASCIVSIIIALFLIKCDYKQWLFKLAKKLKLSNRNDNLSVWESIFENDPVVTLRDNITGNTYFGTVTSISDNCDKREILFENVRVFSEEGDELFAANTLYLSRNHNEFTIETQKEGTHLAEHHGETK
ncbi:MAG: hypothetical protein IJ325_04040 [Clostridia bacterium]|nr:hypothetical protein [Clostridia bacterium]